MTHRASGPDLHVEHIDVPGYDDIRLCHDRRTGLRAIVAIHDTTLGPALGGTRFWPYPDEDAALIDVMRLSEGMTYKAAAVGLPLGGGKAVIMGDPHTLKTPALLRAYGRFVETFAGRYVTAADVGTTSADLDLIGTETAHVVGRTAAHGALGDSGGSTALGVFVSMQTAAEVVLDSSLAGLVVGVEGAGKVGFRLVELLLGVGARVVAADRDDQARQRVSAAFPQVEVVDDVRSAALDIYAPCALGATVSPTVVESLPSRVICGAANNQLSTNAVEDQLVRRGMVWVPDFVANAGGLIQVATERDGGSMEQAHAEVRRLGDSVREILVRAAAERSTPGAAARRVVHDRLERAAARSVVVPTQ